MGACSARDTGQHEQPGTQTLAKCPCGGSTDIPHPSNLTRISFGNRHICFKEQEVEVTTPNTVHFGTPPIKKPCRWTGVTSCEKLDFCLLWKIAECQPSSLQSTLLTADAVPEEEQPDLLAAQTCLHKLNRRSRDEVPVPDGLVPTALYTFFVTALGCGLKYARLIITQCIHAQLQSMCILTRTTRMRVAEFLRQVGAVTSNEDAVTHTRPHVCPLCTLPDTIFFKVQKEHRKASETLIHMSLQKQHESLLRHGKEME